MFGQNQPGGYSRTHVKGRGVQDAQAEDRHALAALIDQLPQSGDTAAVARARVLLRETKPA